MPFGFNVGGGRQESTQETTQRSRINLDPASAREQQLARSVEQTLRSLGLDIDQLYEGYAGAEEIAEREYLKTIKQGAKSAISQVIGRSGLKSSNVNSMISAFNESASRPLAQVKLQQRLQLPYNVISARSNLAGMQAQFLQNYFLNPRIATSERVTTGTATTRGESKQFGFSFGSEQ